MPSAKKKILVVEDDTAIGGLIARVLGQHYQVDVVTDGADALVHAEAARPDCVLLDVNLPNRSGFSIAQALKRSPETARAPIVFLTAQDRSNDVVRGIQAGARHYITKPFKIEDLVAKVKKLVPP